MSPAPSRLAFALLLLVLALFYFYDLGRNDLWMDEIWWAFQVTEPELQDTLRLHAHARPPLLLTLVARAAMQLLPRTEAGFRVLPALLGLLSLVLFWKWSEFLPPATRIGLTGLFGALPPLLTWTHLFKHYTADIAATLVVALAAEAFVSAPLEHRRPYRLALVVLVALGFSFPVFFWVPVAFFLIVGSGVRRRGAVPTRGDLRPALVLLVGALAFLRFWPNDPATFLQFAPGSVPPVSWAARVPWLVLQCGSVVTNPLRPIPLALQAVGLAVGGFIAWKGRRLAGLWLFPILALMAAAGVLGRFPLAGGRFTVFVFPLAFMTFGLGLHAIAEGGARALESRFGVRARGWAPAGLVLAAFALAVPGLRAFVAERDDRPREQVQGALAVLKKEYAEGDGVFVNRLALAGWQWYAGDRSREVGAWRRSPSGIEVYVGRDERFREQSFAEDMRRVFGGEKRRVFFLLTHLEAAPGRETDLAFVRRHVAPFGDVEELHASGGALLSAGHAPCEGPASRMRAVTSS